MAELRKKANAKNSCFIRVNFRFKNKTNVKISLAKKSVQITDLLTNGLFKNAGILFLFLRRNHEITCSKTPLSQKKEGEINTMRFRTIL